MNISYLIDYISGVKVNPISLSPALPQATRRKFIELNYYVIDMLLNILHNIKGEEQLCPRLREFLGFYWKLTQHTSIDYTFNPRFPANEACRAVAYNIRNSNEAICDVLMPTVREVVGIVGAGDETLLDLIEQDGEFNLSEFLASSDGQRLYGITEVFTYSKSDPLCWFGDKFQLTELDRENLENVAGDISQKIVAQIRERYLSKIGVSFSLGFILNELQQALYQSSKEVKGDEHDSDLTEAVPAIRRFHRYWKTLEEATWSTCQNLIISGGTLALESYLLCLFVQAAIPITSEQFSRVQREGILPCTHLISQILEKFLEENHTLLYGCSIIQESENLDIVQLCKDKAYAHELANRKLIGFDDARFLEQVDIFKSVMGYHLGSDSATQLIITCAESISSLSQFTSLLSYTHPSTWRIIAANLKQVAKIFTPIRDEVERATPHIYYTLKHLSRDLWSDLISHFQPFVGSWFLERNLMYCFQFLDGAGTRLLGLLLKTHFNKIIFSAEQLAKMFSILPAEKYPEIENSLGEYARSLLTKNENIASFFSTLSFYCVNQDFFVSLIIPHMKAQCILVPDYLLSLCIQFNSKTCFLSFFKKLLLASREIKLSSALLVKLFRYFQPEYYPELFDAFPDHYYAHHYKKFSTVDSILNTLHNDEQRILFLSFFNARVSDLRFYDHLNPTECYVLLKKYEYCRQLMFSLLTPSFVFMLTSLLSAIFQRDPVGLSTPDEKTTELLNFYCKEMLFHFLLTSRLQWLSRVFSDYFTASDLLSVVDTGYKLYSNFRMLEKSKWTLDLVSTAGATPTISEQEVVEKKLVMLVQFMAQEVQLPVLDRSPLFLDFARIFGTDFFQILYRFCKLHVFPRTEIFSPAPAPMLVPTLVSPAHFSVSFLTPRVPPPTPIALDNELDSDEDNGVLTFRNAV